MKKVWIVLLCLVISIGVFSACSGKEEETTVWQPPETTETDYSSLLSSDTFIGKFQSDGYTAQIWKNDDNEMAIAIQNGTDKWDMSGDFVYENYSISYDNAVKTSADAADGEAAYEKGAGTVTFSDENTFIWDNTTDGINATFARVQE